MTALTGPTVIVLGTMASMPYAGIAWQVLHHLEGLRRLGCDVHYVEDSGQWVYDTASEAVTDDPAPAVRFIRDAMAWWGHEDRWTYRAVCDGEPTFGRTERELDALFRRADALINLTGSTWLRPEHMQVPVRIYLETDPGEPQFHLALGNERMFSYLGAHTHLFTYAEGLGEADCGLPEVGVPYRPTRPPVVADWWEAPPLHPGGRFTTVANFRQEGKDIEWEGSVYTWSKHHEFLRLLDLPSLVPVTIQLALSSCSRADSALLRKHGWQVTDATIVSGEMLAYHSFIRGSLGEFTVAKDQNVRTRSGWFSDRSVCYLAAGRPVVTQDTGFGRNIPTGDGLFAFLTLDEAAQAITAIASDYDRHSQAAREIAAEHFGAEVVLQRLLRDAGLA